MERGFLFRPSLRPSFRPRRRAATRPIIAENGAAAAGDAATVLGSASSFVGNTETGKGGSDESAFSSRDKRRFFERDSGAPLCLAKEHACGLDANIENVQ